MADIELTIQTTDTPLPKQHLSDTLWAVAGQGADEQRPAHPRAGPGPAVSGDTLVVWKLDRLADRCATWRLWIEANTCPARVVGC